MCKEARYLDSSWTQKGSFDCNTLLKCQGNCRFWKRLIIGDDKWIVYKNVKHKLFWSRHEPLPQMTSKAELPSKEGFALRIVGLWFFELPSRNRTTNPKEFSRQWDSLCVSLIQKHSELLIRKEVVSYQRNARPQISLLVSVAMSRIRNYWSLDVMCYLTEVSDFHLFHSLQNSLNGVRLSSDEAVNQYLL